MDIGICMKAKEIWGHRQCKIIDTKNVIFCVLSYIFPIKSFVVMNAYLYLAQQIACLTPPPPPQYQTLTLNENLKCID